MKVPEIRKKLIEAGLESSGVKAILLERLNAHYDELRRKRLEATKNESTDEDDNEEDNESIDNENEEDNESCDDDSEADNESDEEIIELATNNQPINNLIKKITEIGKRGKNINYNIIQKYNNKEDAEKAITDENMWIKGVRKVTKSEGIKHNYLCKFHKTSKCMKKCYLLYHNDNDSVSLFSSEHQHNDHEKISDRGITDTFKKAIDEIYEIY